ncbi:Conserved_hypothetical protein [Hexamita inflata]|uniref:C2 DOCK-type domain-containing protein n=1 Tax=Hexamita inflata TaxID=28002 RepID=A0AA86TW85_9EUKA|nr:Conserved hypothetical protein [Hexamita inflata]
MIPKSPLVAKPLAANVQQEIEFWVPPLQTPPESKLDTVNEISRVLKHGGTLPVIQVPHISPKLNLQDESAQTLASLASLGYMPEFYQEQQLCPTQEVTMNIAFALKKLNLGADQIPAIEPIWGSAALFQKKDGSFNRISEQFYFDMNDQDTQYLFKKSILHEPQRCFKVSLPQDTSNIFLVVRLERLLTANVNDAYEFYQELQRCAAEQTINVNKQEDFYKVYLKDVLSNLNLTAQRRQQMQEILMKYQTKIHTTANRLGAVRQPFLIGFFPIDYKNSEAEPFTKCQLKQCAKAQTEDVQYLSEKNVSTSTLQSLQITPSMTYNIPNLVWVPWQNNNGRSVDEQIFNTFQDLVNLKIRPINYVHMEFNMCYMNFGLVQDGKIIFEQNAYFRNEMSPDQQELGYRQYYEQIRKTVEKLSRKEYESLKNKDPNLVFNSYLQLKYQQQKYSPVVEAQLSTQNCLDTVTAQQVINLLCFLPTLKLIDSYRNLMLVQIQALSLDHVKYSARNLVIKVELRDQNKKALKNFISFYTGQGQCLSHFTSANYHNKQPLFYDEFKINLPEVLTPQHHLFFTVYHISISNYDKKMKDAPLNMDTNLSAQSNVEEFNNVIGQTQHKDQIVFNEIVLDDQGVFKQVAFGWSPLLTKDIQKQKYFDKVNTRYIINLVSNSTDYQILSREPKNSVGTLEMKMMLSSNLHFHHPDLHKFQEIFDSVKKLKTQNQINQLEYIVNKSNDLLGFLQNKEKSDALEYPVNQLIKNSIININFMVQSVLILTNHLNTETAIQNLIQCINNYFKIINDKVQMSKGKQMQFHCYQQFVDQIYSSKIGINNPKIELCLSYFPSSQLTQFLNIQGQLKSTDYVQAFHMMDKNLATAPKSNPLRYFEIPITACFFEQNMSSTRMLPSQMIMSSYIKPQIADPNKILSGLTQFFITCTNMRVEYFMILLQMLLQLDFSLLTDELVNQFIGAIRKSMAFTIVKNRTANDQSQERVTGQLVYYFSLFIVKAVENRQVEIKTIFSEVLSHDCRVTIDPLVIEILIQTKKVVENPLLLKQVIDVISQNIQADNKIASYYIDLLYKLVQLDSMLSSVLLTPEISMNLLNILIINAQKIIEDQHGGEKVDNSKRQMFVTMCVLLQNAERKYKDLTKLFVTDQCYSFALCLLNELELFDEQKIQTKLQSIWDSESSKLKIQNDATSFTNMMRQIFIGIQGLDQNISKYSSSSSSKPIIHMNMFKNTQKVQDNMIQSDTVKATSALKNRFLNKNKGLSKTMNDNSTTSVNLASVIAEANSQPAESVQDKEEETRCMHTFISYLIQRQIEKWILIIMDNNMDCVDILISLLDSIQQKEQISVIPCFTKFFALHNQLINPNQYEKICNIILHEVAANVNTKSEQDYKILLTMIQQKQTIVFDCVMKFSEKATDEESKNAHNFLEQVTEFIKQNAFTKLKQSAERYTEIVRKLKSVISNSRTLKGIFIDKDGYIDLGRVIDLSCAELQELSAIKKHEQMKAIEIKVKDSQFLPEAAYANIECAFLVAESLLNTQRGKELYTTMLERLAPLMGRSSRLYQKSVIKESTLTIAILLNHLQQAATYFSEYGVPDFVIKINNLIREIFLDFGLMLEDYSNLDQLKQLQTQETASERKKLGFFYRVGFYSLFEELQINRECPEYIYHEQQSCRINDMSSKIIQQYRPIVKKLRNQDDNKVDSNSNKELSGQSSEFSLQQSGSINTSMSNHNQSLTLTGSTGFQTIGTLKPADFEKLAHTKQEECVVVLSETDRKKLEADVGYGEVLYVSVQDTRPFEFFAESEGLLDEEFSISHLIIDQLKLLGFTEEIEKRKFRSKQFCNNVFTAQTPTKDKPFGGVFQHFYFTADFLPSYKQRQKIEKTVTVRLHPMVCQAQSFVNKAEILKFTSLEAVNHLISSIFGTFVTMVNEGPIAVTKYFFETQNLEQSKQVVQATDEDYDNGHSLAKTAVLNNKKEKYTIINGIYETSQTEAELKDQYAKAIRKMFQNGSDLIKKIRDTLPPNSDQHALLEKSRLGFNTGCSQIAAIQGMGVYDFPSLLVESKVELTDSNKRMSRTLKADESILEKPATELDTSKDESVTNALSMDPSQNPQKQEDKNEGKALGLKRNESKLDVKQTKTITEVSIDLAKSQTDKKVNEPVINTNNSGVNELEHWNQKPKPVEKSQTVEPQKVETKPIETTKTENSDKLTVAQKIAFFAKQKEMKDSEKKEKKPDNEYQLYK